jgi:glycosyltransferase involved in cell wall biosynthesis
MIPSNPVTIIIPVVGLGWDELAARAQASAEIQGCADVIVSRASSLYAARNLGLEVETEWLCFLDADDELAPGYCEAMLQANGDVIQPATLGVVDGVEDDHCVVIKPAASLRERNHIVIGAFVKTALFRKVGGFDDYPVLEDWALWLKCWRVGASFSVAPEAVYKVHVRSGSRNDQIALHHLWYSRIRNLYK